MADILRGPTPDPDQIITWKDLTRKEKRRLVAGTIGVAALGLLAAGIVVDTIQQQGIKAKTVNEQIINDDMKYPDTLGSEQPAVAGVVK